MYYLGLDIGSSFVKVALTEAVSGKSMLVVHEPKEEMFMVASRSDWAEQNPEIWWAHVCNGIKRVIKESHV